MFKKAFPSPRSQRLTPVFSSKNFIVLALMLRSVVHFDYVLCTVWGRGPPSLFRRWLSSCPSTVCRRFCFPPWIAWAPLVKLIKHTCEGLFLTLNSAPSIYVSVLGFYHCVWMTVALWWVLKSRSINPPYLHFVFKIDLNILGPLHFHMNFRIGLSIFAKKPAEILMEIVLNL